MSEINAKAEKRYKEHTRVLVSFLVKRSTTLPLGVVVADFCFHVL